MSSPKILIVGPSWVGDMVMAQSLFIQLKQQHPQAQIDVLAPAWSQPLLARMPQVHQSIKLDTGHGELGFKKRWRIASELRAKKYDQAILLPNSLKSALIPLLARIPLRTGWKGESRYGFLNDLRQLDKTALPFMVQRFVALAFKKSHPVIPLNEIDAPLLQVKKPLIDQALKALNLNTQKPILALCPGAEFGPAKQWPTKYYAQIASEYIDAGGQVWLFGSANDIDDCQQIIADLKAQQVDNCLLLAGKTSLEQAIDLLSLADLVVSNDSGLMHVAAALHKSLIAIYGSTSAQFTPPLLAQDKHALVSIPVDCGPCFKRQCSQTGGRYLRCLNDILPHALMPHVSQLSQLDFSNSPLLSQAEQTTQKINIDSAVSSAS